MNTLTFNEVNFKPVEQNGQIWLTSGEVAKALGYKNTKSISNLYSANSDEFTPAMTEVIESVTSSKTKGLKVRTRIFSLRGCHALAFFARTNIAKQFRKWVLDILDREVSTRTDAKQREPLVAACDKLAIGNTLRSDVYTMVANHFGYEKVTQIPAPLLPEAVAFTYEMILARQKPSNAMSDGALMNNRMWKDVGFAKTEQVCLKTQELASLLAWASQKLGEIKSCHSTIFDIFSEQTWNGLTPEQIDRVDKQGKLFL